MSDKALVPPAPEPEKRPTTREGRAAAVKPWRTSTRLKRRFRRLLSSRELYASLEKIIKDPKNPHFLRALELMLRYAEIPVVTAPTLDDDDDNFESMQPTALPPIMRVIETVRKVYGEDGSLVKVFGKKELKLGKGALPPAPPRDNVEDADYTIEESS